MRLLVLSDIHYASAAEQARSELEVRSVGNRFLRTFLKYYRNYIWLRAPTRQNHLLAKCIGLASFAEIVVANGDFSCDTASIGLADDAAFESARECLRILRSHFGARLELVFGDHELGKRSFFGGRGGMRALGYDRCVSDLGIKPFWTRHVGRYVLIGVVSSLAALPVMAPETVPDELLKWERLRREHFGEIAQFLNRLPSDSRIILFCHDPTALPFLWRETAFAEKIGQIEHTIIGHLHSPLVYWKSQRLAGMPAINFLGNTARRMSTALRESREWKRFNVSLCPALSGVELLKDGGWLTIDLDPDATRPARITRHWLPR